MAILQQLARNSTRLAQLMRPITSYPCDGDASSTHSDCCDHVCGMHMPHSASSAIRCYGLPAWHFTSKTEHLKQP
jgi:hypothetical protein